jgi:hypothetical protein
MESRLFQALDCETDREIAAQLRATLRTLLHTGVPIEPSHWLDVSLCHFPYFAGHCFLSLVLNHTI